MPISKHFATRTDMVDMIASCEKSWLDSKNNSPLLDELKKTFMPYGGGLLSHFPGGLTFFKTYVDRTHEKDTLSDEEVLSTLRLLSKFYKSMNVVGDREFWLLFSTFFRIDNHFFRSENTEYNQPDGYFEYEVSEGQWKNEYRFAYQTIETISRLDESKLLTDDNLELIHKQIANVTIDIIDQYVHFTSSMNGDGRDEVLPPPLLSQPIFTRICQNVDILAHPEVLKAKSALTYESKKQACLEQILEICDDETVDKAQKIEKILSLMKNPEQKKQQCACQRLGY